MAGRVESMKNLIWFVLLLVGCSESATELTAWQKAMRDGSVEAVEVAKAVEEKTDAAVVILKENTAALERIETKLEASLSSPKSNGTEVIKSAPEPPATANDTQNPLKVATPAASFRTASDGTVLRWNVEGNWSPTILETSRHLGADHGIDTNGMTHQEMADIHASIHDGKQIPVSAVRVKNAGAVSNCPGGMCPTNRTQRRRGLFGGLFR
jgi:hypothetical protein